MKKRRCGGAASTTSQDDGPLDDPEDRQADAGGCGTVIVEVEADAKARPFPRRVLGKRKLGPYWRGVTEENQRRIEEEDTDVCEEAVSAHSSAAAEDAATTALADDGGGGGGRATLVVSASRGSAPASGMTTGALPSGHNSVQSSSAGDERSEDFTRDGAQGSAHAAVRRRLRGKSSRLPLTEARGTCEPREGLRSGCLSCSPPAARDMSSGQCAGGSGDFLVPANFDGEKNTLKSTFGREVQGGEGRAAVVESTATATGRRPS